MYYKLTENAWNDAKTYYCLFILWLLLTVIDVQVRVQSVLKQQKNRSTIDQTSEKDRLEWYAWCELLNTDHVVSLRSLLELKAFAATNKNYWLLIQTSRRDLHEWGYW